MAEPLARGIRNNNPGNLRVRGASRGEWIGQKGNDHHGFLTFYRPVEGLHALACALVEHAGRDHVNTVVGLVAEFSPGGESSERSYSKYLAEELDVGEFEKINIPDRLEPLMRAIIQYECGGMPYTQEQLTDAIPLAELIGGRNRNEY